MLSIRVLRWAIDCRIGSLSSTLCSSHFYTRLFPLKYVSFFNDVFCTKYKIFHPFSSYVEEIARERNGDDSFLVKESLFSFQELLPG